MTDASRTGPAPSAARGRGRGDRATATTLSYVLTLGITAILISGLLAAAGTTVETQREDTTREALEVVGQQISSRVMAADRLVASGASAVTVRGTYPESVAGSTYSVVVRSGPPPEIELTATGVDVSVTVGAATRTPVADASLSGGDVEIVYTGGQLEVRGA
ncbi:DUF7266 family protein [Halobaculum sp. EA56]|uniref:DUF7266 family protein n=1 Tax=Halobaculum sp. EA56 TaxID=3421648 RepID=UPI003EC12EE7